MKTPQVFSREEGKEKPDDVATAFVDGKYEKFVIPNEDERPLVLLFGWAGASEKNLQKYADIYHKVNKLN